MCRTHRTHTTQHELSAIAQNFVGGRCSHPSAFADIRVGATSADIVVEVVHTCTHAWMHAPPCAACRQAPAALEPSRQFAYELDIYCANQIWNGVAPVSAVTLLHVWPAAHARHATCSTQHATCNMQHAARNTPHAARNMECATCNMHYATCSTHNQISRGVAGLCRGAAASWLAGALAAGTCVSLGMVGV
jgi:hypothetical protein